MIRHADEICEELSRKETASETSWACERTQSMQKKMCVALALLIRWRVR